MDSLVEKCQKKSTKKNLGIGYPEETCLGVEEKNWRKQ